MKFVCSYPPLLKTKVMDSDIFLSKHKSMIFSLVSSNKENESLFLFPQYWDNNVFFRFPLKNTLVFTHLWSLRPKIQITNSKLQSINWQITWIYRFKNWNNYVHRVVLEVKQAFHCTAYVNKNMNVVYHCIHRYHVAGEASSQLQLFKEDISVWWCTIILIVILKKFTTSEWKEGIFAVPLL